MAKAAAYKYTLDRQEGDGIQDGAKVALTTVDRSFLAGWAIVSRHGGRDEEVEVEFSVEVWEEWRQAKAFMPHLERPPDTESRVPRAARGSIT